MTYKQLFYSVKRQHSMSPIFSGQRHLGLVLSTMGWFLLAFITIFMRDHVSLYGKPGAINLFCFHIGIIGIFFIFGIPYGKQFFKCNNPKLILLRGLLAVASFWGYTFAKNWSTQIDHALLYSIDPLWTLLLLLIANYKVTKLSWIGIITSLVGVGVIYVFNFSGWTDVQGFTFGLASGAGLAVIILITYTLIKTDHPSRIGFYQGVIGALFALSLLLYFHLTGSVGMPKIQEVIASLFLGIAFSLALYCFIQSSFYTEPYVISVTGYSLIFFTEIINWMLTKELLPLTSLIGTLLIVFGGVKVVLGSYFTEEKKRHSSFT